MDITVYTFEDADGSEMNFSTQDVTEAREYARDNECLAIDNTYEWSESEPVPQWDYRPKTEPVEGDGTFTEDDQGNWHTVSS